MNFHNKTVVITGAANGIGESIAYGYAKEGARVVLADIDEEKGKRLEDQLKKESFEAFLKNGCETREGYSRHHVSCCGSLSNDRYSHQ